MKTSLLVLGSWSLAALVAGCAHAPRTHSETGSEVGTPAQKHQVTLMVDGKVVGQWTTTGKVEVNGAVLEGNDVNQPPPIRELPATDQSP